MQLNPKVDLAEMLRQLQTQKARVGIYLRGGHFLAGKVVDVGDHFVVLAELQGKDFFDAQIRVDEIAALETKVR
jgi:sRNA-binding regulator protein Hfq